MRYLALGDSISVDAYTGVDGGGAVSQFARKIGAAEVQDLTQDGNVTWGVLEDLNQVSITPDVVTLTAGGNDLLVGRGAEEILANLAQIAARLAAMGGRVILNTIYDPSDGDDALAAETGIEADLRVPFNAVNAGIRRLAEERGFLLPDLEKLFHGHGLRSEDPWYVNVIEPNLEGATAIANHWYELLQGR